MTVAAVTKTHVIAGERFDSELRAEGDATQQFKLTVPANEDEKTPSKTSTAPVSFKGYEFILVQLGAYSALF